MVMQPTGQPQVVILATVASRGTPALVAITTPVSQSRGR